MAQAVVAAEEEELVARLLALEVQEQAPMDLQWHSEVLQLPHLLQ